MFKAKVMLKHWVEATSDKCEIMRLFYSTHLSCESYFSALLKHKSKNLGKLHGKSFVNYVLFIISVVDKVKQIIPQRIRSYITGKIGVWRDDQIVSIAYIVARFIYAKAIGVCSVELFCNCALRLFLQPVLVLAKHVVPSQHGM